MKKLTNMTNADYHGAPAIGSSTLKLATDSLAKLKAQIDGLIPRKSSTSMDIGTSAHAAILEQDFSRYIVGPDVSKNTKAWKECVAKNEGRVVLKPEEYKIIRHIFETFFAHPLAGKLIQGGEAEASYFTTIEGVDYKARPDYFVEGHEKGDYIVDYKTARSSEFREFQKSIYNYRYDLQAAHYMRVVGEVTGRPVGDYFWIVQETEAPFEIAVYRADPDLVHRASLRCERLYKDIGEAFATGVFASRTDSGVIDIDLPEWAVTKEEESE